MVAGKEMAGEGRENKHRSFDNSKHLFLCSFAQTASNLVDRFDLPLTCQILNKIDWFLIDFAILILKKKKRISIRFSNSFQLEKFRPPNISDWFSSSSVVHLPRNVSRISETYTHFHRTISPSRETTLWGNSWGLSSQVCWEEVESTLMRGMQRGTRNIQVTRSERDPSMLR